MKQIDNGDTFRGAGKRARRASLHAISNAKDLDDARPEAEVIELRGNDDGSGLLSNQQQTEFNQASAGNQRFLTTIEAVWPTPSAPGPGA